MNEQPEGGRLISFDEAGFTGPQLLNQEQPYFVYASHDLSPQESQELLEKLRSDFSIKSKELKASNLKRKDYWSPLTQSLCAALNRRAMVVTYNKKVALAGKFYEYFFEPVLAKNSALFYRIDFHRFIMNTIFLLMSESTEDYGKLAVQMQHFMRKFDLDFAPQLFNLEGNHPIEMQRILQFCSGFSSKIEEESQHLRSDKNLTSKWTLDLTNTALFALLFFGWGHRYPQLQLLCDASKPLQDHADFFNNWVGKEQSVELHNGRERANIRGNLVAPIEFGSSEAHPSLQVADLIAGMTMEVCIRKQEAHVSARKWVNQHLMHTHSIEHDPELVRKGNPNVRVAREVLKELAQRAENGSDPLSDMDEFVRKTENRFK